MLNVYAYSRDDQIVIGNDFIERRFSSHGDKLRTVEIVNKQFDSR